MKVDLVTILMPARNAGKFIDTAIRSIINQTYREWELIVCDDCSSDNTFDRIQYYAEMDNRIRVYRNSQQLGYLKTCNRLYVYADGEFVAFQDADDECDPRRIEEQLRLIRDDQNKFCGCDMQYMSLKGNRLSKYVRKREHLENPFPRIGDSSLLVRKSQIERIGGLYRPFFINHQDYDLGLRLFEVFTYVNLDKPFYYYRNVPNSNSKKFNDPKYVINGEIARELAVQRRAHGFDFLDLGDEAAMRRLVDSKMNIYHSDKSALERRAVSYLISIEMYRTALPCAIRAIFKDPFNLLPYRSFFYLLRAVASDSISSFFKPRSYG